MKPLSIRARLLVMAALALVPLLAVLALGARSTARVREEAEVAANLEVARAIAAAFSAFVADVQRTAAPLGETLAGGRLSEEEGDQLLARTLSAYEGVLTELSWASPAGEIVRSTRDPAVGIRVGDRDYFLRLLAGDDAVVSDLLEMRTSGTLAFVIAVAVRDADRRLRGVVLAPVAPARLLDHTLSTRRTGTGAFSLVDRAGRVVVGAPALDLSWTDREIASRQAFVRRALEGEEAFGTFEAEDGTERLAAAVPVARTGWAARASRAAEEVRSPVRRELLGSALLALAAGAAWLAASTLLARRVSGALEQLEAHADALGRGERAPAPALALPEVARLADRYAAMAERLQASREAFSTAFAAAPAALAVLDGATLRARRANPAFLALAAEPWRTRGVEGARVEELVPGGDRIGLAEQVRRVATGDLPLADSEHRFDGPRGPTWLRWSLRGIPSADRAGARDVLFLATDVTEQVLARRRVEEDRRRLEAVLRMLPVGVVIADPSGRIATSNDAVQAILGGPPPAASDARLRGWWASSGAPLAPGDWPLSRALSRRETVAGELIDVQLREGRRATLLVSAVPFLDAAGELGGAVVAVEDVTALRSAERRERLLREAGAVVAETLEFDEVGRRLAAFAVPQVADFCRLDEVLPDGSLREIAAVRGASPGEGAGALLDALIRRALSARRTVTAPGEGEDGGDAALAAAGVRSALSVPLVSGGGVHGVLTLATAAARARLAPEDVRAAEELAEVAAQALENARLFGEARRAVEARDEVLSVVSHDLRNPLGAITLAARLLVELPEGPAAAERARATGARILRAGERMARLIGDLLDLASLRAGRLALERAPCAPADLLREAADEVRGAAGAKGLAVRVEAAPGLPALACDRGRVLQVLGNLASNAVKATERGEVRLAAEAGAREVVFSVSDTGPGIPAEERERLFERFRRGAGARYEGAGLGLSIARALVEAHGGRIWIEGAPAAGTTIRFTIPVEPGPARRAGPAGQGPAAASAGTAAAGR